MAAESRLCCVHGQQCRISIVCACVCVLLLLLPPLTVHLVNVAVSLSAALSPSASAEERRVTGEEKRQRPRLQRSLVPVTDTRERGGHVALRANSAGAGGHTRYKEKAPGTIEPLSAAPYAYLARFVSRIIGLCRPEHIHAFIPHINIYLYIFFFPPANTGDE